MDQRIRSVLPKDTVTRYAQTCEAAGFDVMAAAAGRLPAGAVAAAAAAGDTPVGRLQQLMERWVVEWGG